jgi:hypothetical protein
MGNACCGSDETRKSGAFVKESSDSAARTQHETDPNEFGSTPQHPITNDSDDPVLTQQELALQSARSQAVLDEQARLEVIVETTNRAMVPVRSTRGSTGYYDQGFAAALYEHLEQTTATNKVSMQQQQLVLPHNLSNTTQTNYTVEEQLTAPMLDGVLSLGATTTTAAAENPETYIDHVAESLLAESKRLFVGCKPIVESLL